MDGGNNLLVVICDVNMDWWTAHNGIHDARNSFEHCMDSLLVFCNSYLMLNHTNKLAFIACHSEKCMFIYPPAIPHIFEESKQTDGKFDVLTELNDLILNRLKSLINDEGCDATQQNSAPSLIAGALTKALCYIHSCDKGVIGQKTKSRILLLKSSSDASAQYMSVMNCIFAAQKKNVIIDCCSLKSNSGFLQQACDITGGTYFNVENLTGLLEYLLWIFLPEQDLRDKMNLPSSVQIDYRAACFCHKQLVDVGFVCSVCLSIYCKFIPKCVTCQTRFKLPQLSIAGKNKKRMKSKNE